MNPRSSEQSSEASSLNSESMVVSLGLSTRIMNAAFGVILLFIATVAVHVVNMNNGTYIGLASAGLFFGILFLIGSFAVISSFPRSSYLRMDATGVAVRDVFIIKHRTWSSVASISEEHYLRGRDHVWGILISPRAETGVRKLFVRDQYCIKRSALTQTMRHLWSEANSKADGA